MTTRNLMNKMLMRLMVGGIMFAAVALPDVAFADSDADYPEYAAYDGEWVDLNDNLLSEMSVSRLLDGIKWGLGKIELTEGYQSPIGVDEREMMIKSVTARHGKFWIPRKLSTAIGRLEETLKYAKGITDAWAIGKIIGITAGAKSFDDAVDTFAEEGVFQGSAFGEAGYWASTIIFGMTHGKSFVDAIIDGYDEKNIGLWSKLGVTFGGWIADGVIMLTEDKDAKAAADKAFRDYLIAQGINSDGLAVVDAWLSLSSENRAKTPLIYDSSWFENGELIMNQDDWLRISYRQTEKEYQNKPFDATFSLGADITIDLSKDRYLKIGNLNVGYDLCGMSNFSGIIKGNGHKVFVTGKSLVHDGEGSFLIFKATGAKFENVTFCGRGIREAANCEFYGCGIESFAIAQTASDCQFEKCGGKANMSPLKYGETKFTGRGALACEAKNCEFRDCLVEGQGGDDDAGALVGQAEGCSFVNCLATAEVSSVDIAGGLVGWAEGCEFSNCAATGDVSGHGEVGGFVGYSAESLFAQCQARGKVIGGKSVGGFAGDLRGKSIVECVATGDVYCEETLTGAPADIGGFAGQIINGAAVEDCAATGAVYASGATEVGGFAGSVHGEVSVQRCYASGRTVGGSFVGGFAGSLSECKVYNCYATGGAEAKGYSMGGGMATSTSAYAGGFSGLAMSEGGADCRYCYATGKVSALGGDSMTTIAGGFTPLSVPDSMAASMEGYLSMLMSDSIECYWDVPATGCKYSGMGTGLGGSAMKTASSFSGWDASIWVFNGGYPYFTKLGKTGEISDIVPTPTSQPDPVSPEPVSPDPVNPDPVTPGYEVVDEKDVVAPYDVPKAVTIMGAVYDGNGAVIGIVELKLGKVNANKGTGKVSGSFVDLDGKKHAIKGPKLEGINGTSPLSVTLDVKDFGAMVVTIGGELFAGSLGGYHVQSANVGGSWTGRGATVGVDAGDVSMFAGTVLTDLLPNDEQATANGGKWAFKKAAGVKWAKPKKGAEPPEIYDEESGKGLIVDTSKDKTNLSGLKLTYTPKKGSFKGSFKVYALEGEGKATKLKKYTVKVNGVVVDGVGYGTATCKKPAASWPVTVR